MTSKPPTPNLPAGRQEGRQKLLILLGRAETKSNIYNSSIAGERNKTEDAELGKPIQHLFFYRFSRISR